MSTLSNTTAAVKVHERSKTVPLSGAKDIQTPRQFSQVTEHQPRKYKSRLQNSVYPGLNARRDAKTAERRRLFYQSASIIVHSGTPLGILLTAEEAAGLAHSGIGSEV